MITFALSLTIMNDLNGCTKECEMTDMTNGFCNFLLFNDLYKIELMVEK